MIFNQRYNCGRAPNICEWMYTNYLFRCFLSAGGGPLAAISPALRLVQVKWQNLVLVKLANNKFPLSAHSNPNFTCCLLSFESFKVKLWQPGGRLLKWQPTGVEGGGGRTASFTKVRATSYLDRRCPLRHRWWRWWFQRPHLDPLLGPSRWVLATCWRPCCGEILPCSRRSSNFTYWMLIWQIQFKTLNTIGNFDTRCF